jgi:3-deoxy-7-phosphoheptulonate synthase
VAQQIAGGSAEIFGVMFESFLVGGRQNAGTNVPLVYGQSITDPCLDWESTEPLLKELAAAVRERRQAQVPADQTG